MFSNLMVFQTKAHAWEEVDEFFDQKQKFTKDHNDLMFIRNWREKNGSKLFSEPVETTISIDNRRHNP